MTSKEVKDAYEWLYNVEVHSWNDSDNKAIVKEIVIEYLPLKERVDDLIYELEDRIFRCDNEEIKKIYKEMLERLK